MLTVSESMDWAPGKAVKGLRSVTTPERPGRYLARWRGHETRSRLPVFVDRVRPAREPGPAQRASSGSLKPLSVVTAPDS